MMKIVLLSVLFLAIQESSATSFSSLNLPLRFKSGSNPFMLYGNLPVPPPARISETDVFRSSGFADDADNKEGIYIRVKVGSNLRFNLIKVFGYILHRKKMELNTSYYTSLYFILTCIKLNHLDLISLVGILHSITHLKPNEQFHKLFQDMEKHLPQYLSCAATYWKEGIQNKEIDMERILIPYGDDTLVINVLEDMTPVELLKASNAELIDDYPDGKEEEMIFYNFNVNILHLTRFLQKKKGLKLENWLLAGLLQFFPRTVIQPDLEESINIIVQFLYETDIKELKTITVPSKDAWPLKVTTILLDKIINHASVINIVKDSAQVVMRNLKPRNPTAVNQHYSSFTHYIQPDSVKIEELLNYVLYGQYPLEIQLAARRIQHYIANNFIDYLRITTNFNPYLYSSPTEVLIAVLDRILRRQQNLAPEVVDSVGAVYSYLIFKYRYTKMPVVFPTDMINMNVLLLGLKAPDLAKPIRNAASELIIMLQKQPLKYSAILEKKVPIYKCTTPVICLIHLLMEIKIMSEEVVGEDLIKIIEIIVNCDCRRGHCPINYEKPEQIELFPDELRNTTINQCRRYLEDEMTTPTETTRPPPTTPTEGPPVTKATSPATSPTTPTARSPETTVFQVIMTTPSTLSEGDILTVEIQSILQQEKYKKQLLQVDFKYENIAVIITGYSMHLTVKNIVHTEAHFEQYFAIYMKMWKRVRYSMIWIQQPQLYDKPIPIQLSVALPTPKTDNEKEYFATIKSILNRKDIFDHVVDKIKKEEEVNVAVFLKAMFQEELKLTSILTENELEAIKYYVGRIQKHGFGETKIQYSIQTKMIEKEVDFSNNMDNALDFNSLDNEQQKMFNGIVSYIQKNPNVLESWDKWVFYNTCGEFTLALFQYLLRNTGLPTDIRSSITELSPLINYDEGGLLPSFPKD